MEVAGIEPASGSRLRRNLHT